MLFTLYLIFVIVSAIYYFLTWNNKYFENRGIPSPKPKILVGNVSESAKMKQHILYDYQKVYDQFKGQYSFCGLFNLREPQYMILDPSLARDLLINKFTNFHDNGFSDIFDKNKDPILKKNSFVLKGEDWKNSRTEITPAFTSLRIKAMYPVIEDVCERMKQYILRENIHAIETTELTSKFTTDVVSSCIFGVDAGSFASENAPILEMARRVVGYSPKLLFYYVLVQIIPTLRKFLKMSFVDKEVQQFFINLMKDAIELRKTSKIDRADYLHFLLELQQKKNLTELDMVSHAITFLIDGFETSSIVLKFLLYELAKNKEVQEKLRREIRETLERHGEITYDIASEMPYLEQVMCESLRLHPPGYNMTKICTESCEVNLTETEKRIIEKGHTVIIPIYSFQRDPRYHDDPDKFIPERFAAEKGGVKAHKDQGTFMSFGVGPRSCLGMRFAQTQLKAAVISIIRNFEVTVDPKTPKNFVYDPNEMFFYILGGIWLQYKEIKS
ncbi:Cytochrome P450 [Sergentomyia squamirostris]